MSLLMDDLAIDTKSGIQKGITSLVTSHNRITMNYRFDNTASSLSIYSLSGKKLATKSLDPLKGTLTWKPSIAAGSYVLEVINGTERLTRQIILK